jgi:hypothetical protein
MPVLVLTLVIVAFAVAAIWIGRRSAHRAGLSEDTPACARCLYPLGGWSRSNCPECGNDLRKIGVRIGSQSARYILAFIVVMVGIFGGGWLAGSVFGWIFAVEDLSWDTRWTSIDQPEYHVTLRSESHWRRFPRRSQFEGDIDFVRLAPEASGSWYNNHWQGPTPLATSTLVSKADEPPPSRESIANAIAVVSQGTAHEIQEQQCNALTKHLESIWFAAAHGQIQELQFSAPPQLFSRGSGGSGGTRGSSWPAFVCSAIVVVLFIVIGIRFINRYCHSGWRPPKPREWEIPRTC